VLSESENRLLEKGLLFVPTIKTFPINEIVAAKDEICRKVKIKDFFKDSDKNSYSNEKKLQNKSTWQPPISKITEDTIETVSKLNCETIKLLQSLPGTTKGSLILPGKVNLDREETLSLKTLKNNNSIVIKSADKGGAIVIMDKEAYINEANRQLQNTKYYRKIDEPIYPENTMKINLILDDLFHRRKIEKKEYDYLRADSETARTRLFYLLPKIHKNRESWPQLNRMPEGRPIVSDCSSESYHVSEYIDKFLKPLSVLHPAYLKDTYDFVDKITNVEIADSHLLVTGDITSLYTNMNIERILKTVEEAFDKYPNSSRPSSEVLELLEITLKGNDFSFNDEFYLQVSGTAMGKRYAPALANLYLEYFDHMAMNGFRIKPTFYRRYLDDLIIIWPGTVEELKEYNVFLNNIIPDITVTLKSHESQIDFLDTTVYRSNENNNKLFTKVFFKETDSHQLLHTSSFHPKHTCTGVLKSQLLRFKRLSSTYDNYAESCFILFNALKERGYSKRKFRKMKREIWLQPDKKSNNTVSESTTGNKDMISLCLRYNQLGNKFMQKWKSIIQENFIFDDYRLVAAYSRNKNLASYLVSAKVNTQLKEAKQLETNLDSKQGFTLCNSSKCLTCRYHATEKDSFRSNSYGSIFKIKEAVNCGSKNIIYLVTCKQCKLQYVGETSRALRDRTTDHRSNITTKKQTPISLHFNSENHSYRDLEIVAIEKISQFLQKNVVTIRKQREEFWQIKLGTKFPAGLNCMPINKYK